MDKRNKQENMTQSLNHIEEQYLRMPEATLITRLEMYKDAFLSEVEFELQDELKSCNGRSHIQAKEELQPLFKRIRNILIKTTSAKKLEDENIDGLMELIERALKVCDFILKKRQAPSRERGLEKFLDLLDGRDGRPSGRLDSECTELKRLINLIKSKLTEPALKEVSDQLWIIRGDHREIMKCKRGLLSVKNKIEEWHQSKQLQGKRRVVASYRQFFVEALSEYEREFDKIMKHIDTNEDLVVEKEFVFESQKVEPSRSEREDESITIRDLLNGNLESIPFYELDSTKDERTVEDLERIEQLNLEKERLLDGLFKLGVTPEDYQKAYAKRSSS